MNKQALDYYGNMPKDMKDYLRHYGWHFNKAAFDYAASLMKRKNPTTGKEESVEVMQKDSVDTLMSRFGLKLDNAVGYDSAYVATAAMADHWRGSLEDERHLALHIKEVVDDCDQADGFIMHRWYSDMIRKGMPVMWEDFM